MPSFIATLLCLILSFSIANAKIINGYTNELKKAEMALKNLNALTQDTTLSRKKKNLLKRKIREISIRKKRCTNYYQRTEALLLLLTKREPDLFFEIDNIMDAEGNLVDVYVRVVGDNVFSNGVVATTNLACDKGNPNIYVSEFGPKSVSVHIYKYGNPLMNLIHEFGHVRYQVPNLASYMEYYMLNYTENYIEKNGQKLGHKYDDPSHQSVAYTKKRHYKNDKNNPALTAKK